MTKLELIDSIAHKLNIDAHQVERVINAATRIIRDELKHGGKVQLIGFGTFEVKERAPHNALNPRTGEPIVIPAHKLPCFKPGKPLKTAVNS